LREANEKLEYSRLSPKKRLAYDSYVDMCRSNESSIYTARLDGKTEGREEGRAEGREEGRAEGREEGRAEGKIEVARNMKTKGLAPALISEITGLPTAEIAGL
jgi:predicted transposase/invertase (TIGR01784 family)